MTFTWVAAEILTSSGRSVENRAHTLPSLVTEAINRSARLLNLPDVISSQSSGFLPLHISHNINFLCNRTHYWRATNSNRPRGTLQLLLRSFNR